MRIILRRLQIDKQVVNVKTDIFSITDFKFSIRMEVHTFL